jgi:hypothetical protein
MLLSNAVWPFGFISNAVWPFGFIVKGNNCHKNKTAAFLCITTRTNQQKQYGGDSNS